ncbi:hypothetical protein AB0C93_11035 [Streptomyces sp. NPDC048518]|uniref:hypothetical protein n=1 Tax=Streptomyces sp. NPDC048518 TaxID=3155029 RepID=UPI0033CF1B17
MRCPGCRREHLYVPPAYPCACGAPVTPPVDRGAAPEPVTDRAWADEWVTVRCGACGRPGHWPRPELDCVCGVVLRVPVISAGGEGLGSGAGEHCGKGPGREDPGGGPGREDPGSGPGREDPREDGPPEPPAPSDPPAHISLPRTAPRPRPAFRPVTIRDARDAVTVAALYLRWLGYPDTRSAARRPPSGARIAARGLLAQVEAALRPTTLRDVECLWLTAMTEAGDTPVTCACFSLAGYTAGARTRADTLGVPLFTMDLTGTPQPVNSAADELVATGA